jgi:carbon monoxide dehydrogenase subunit G
VKSARRAAAAPHRLEQRLEIAAPRDEVWSLVEDPDALMQWVHGLQSVTSPSGMSGGFSLGATFVLRIRIGLIPTACRGEVVECVPPSRVAVVVHHSLFDLDISYSFAAAGRRTEVTCQAAVRGKALGSVIPRHKVEEVTAGILTEHLDALRALAERA